MSFCRASRMIHEEDPAVGEEEDSFEDDAADFAKASPVDEYPMSTR
ncbi:hypothetical protein [Streptomyces sp. Tue6028]